MRRTLTIFILWKVFQVINCAKGSYHWDYSLEGQATWADHYPQCDGQWQSPIMISDSKSMELPLPALEMVGYHDFLPPSLVFENNGHTIQLLIGGEKTKSNKNPYIFGAMLNENEKYLLEGFHFHWGSKNNRGSEHVLYGTRYPMELHLVHRNSKYPDVPTANKQKDGLSVVGIFFHIEEEDNPRLQPLIKHIPEIQRTNSMTQVNDTLMLSWLLPKQMDIYYTYRGSLTTPPCSEAVTWIVFADSVPISNKQMEKFSTLMNGNAVLADNYRHLQKLGRRNIYVRRSSSFIDRNDIISDLNVSSLPWTS